MATINYKFAFVQVLWKVLCNLYKETNISANM